MIEVCAMNINPYNNKPRRTEIYLVDCNTQEAAIAKIANLKSSDDSIWQFTADKTDEIVLIDIIEE